MATRGGMTTTRGNCQWLKEEEDQSIGPGDVPYMAGDGKDRWEGIHSRPNWAPSPVGPTFGQGNHVPRRGKHTARTNGDVFLKAGAAFSMRWHPAGEASVFPSRLHLCEFPAPIARGPEAAKRQSSAVGRPMHLTQATGRVRLNRFVCQLVYPRVIKIQLVCVDRPWASCRSTGKKRGERRGRRSNGVLRQFFQYSAWGRSAASWPWLPSLRRECLHRDAAANGVVDRRSDKPRRYPVGRPVGWDGIIG